MTVQQTGFEQDCHETISRLRAALIELYDSLEADPANPQDMARRLGVNKTLTWTLAKIVEGADSLSVAPQVPGLGSLERMLRATEVEGAPAATVERVRSAVREFDRMVEEHVGDRAGLGLLVDSMGSGRSDSLELSRKLAFRGNSGIFGVQARTRLQSWLVTPNADDPARIDMATISGYVGFRRLRGTVRWPLYKVRHWTEPGDAPVAEHWVPLDPDAGEENRVALMREFTRGAEPDIQAIETAEGIDCVLQPGLVGNAGAFDCFRGEVLQGATDHYRSAVDETGEFGAAITTPSENLVLDIIAHEDVAFTLGGEVLVFAQIYAAGERTGTADGATILPIHPEPIELSGSPPAVATALVPGYAEILRTVAGGLGWDLRRFRGIRIQLKYPPLWSTVMSRFTLPARD